jgi:uncharacterized membrane protein YciS (DUF1049 family)
MITCQRTLRWAMMRKKLLSAIVFGLVCFLGVGFTMVTIMKPYVRWVRVRVKALRLAFKARRITREIKAVTKQVIAEHGKVTSASTGL